MSKKKFLLLILVLFAQQVQAFEAANPFWLAVKPKLVKFLDAKVKNTNYSYQIDKPARELTNFLGKRANLEIKFSQFNMNVVNSRKTVVATAYDENNKALESLPIFINMKTAKKVLCLKTPLSKGEEIKRENIYEKVINIDPRDVNLYYDGVLAQKVANYDIGAGVGIKVNQVRHQKLIQSGETIKVVSKNKVIELEFICKAMNSGDIGDIITVHCDNLQHSSKKVKITDRATAELI